MSHPLPLKAVSKTNFWSVLMTASRGIGPGMVTPTPDSEGYPYTPAHPIDQLFHHTRIGPHTRRTRTSYTR